MSSMRLVDEGRLDLDTAARPYRAAAECGHGPQSRAHHRAACAGAFERPAQLGVEPLVTGSAPGSALHLFRRGDDLAPAGGRDGHGNGPRRCDAGEIVRPGRRCPAALSAGTRGSRGRRCSAIRASRKARALPAQPTRELGNRLLPVAAQMGQADRVLDLTRIPSRRCGDRSGDAAVDPRFAGQFGGRAADDRFDYAKFMALMTDRPERAALEISEASRQAMLTPQLEVRGRDITRGAGLGTRAIPARSAVRAQRQQLRDLQDAGHRRCAGRAGDRRLHQWRERKCAGGADHPGGGGRNRPCCKYAGLTGAGQKRESAYILLPDSGLANRPIRCKT